MKTWWTSRGMRHSIKACANLALSAFLAILMFGAPAAADTRELRVGSETDFRPYAFIDKSGQATGFSVELINAVAGAMGLKVQITTGSWDSAWNGLLNGQVDVLPIVARSPARQELVDFSLPHTETFDSFFVRQGQPVLTSLAAAAGKEIVVMRSDAAHHALLDQHFAGKLVLADSIPQGLRLVASGKHDAFLCSKLIGILEMQEHGIRVLTAGPPVPDYKRVFSFAVHKGNADLLEQLNQGLLIIKSNGEYDRIYRRWLTADEPWRQWLPHLKWPIVGLVVLSGLVALLQWLVRRRTRELALANRDIQAEVAERRKAEAALTKAKEKVQAERQRFLDVLETLPVIVALFRPNHRIVWVNRAYREALGDNVGQLCYAGQFGRDKPCEECQAFIPLQTGQPQHWEWTLPTGQTFDIYNFPFADADGSPMILEMDMDITARRLAEAALAERTAEVQHRAEQLQALAAQLSQAEQKERARLAMLLHDGLQQLLVGTKYHANVLRGELTTPQQREMLSHVDELLDESLDTSRSLTVDLSPPILQHGSMAQVLQWLADWIRRKHGLVVKLHADEKAHPDSPEVRGLLFNVVRELLFNAVKHARVDHACVELSRTDNGQIKVVVADAGQGFDPSEAQAGDGQGSGLGLFSIRERLDWLGGQLEVVSAPGEGTRATVLVPMRLKSVLDVVPAAAKVAPAAAREPAESDGKAAGKIRVILADDHAVVRDGLSGMLQRQLDIEVVGQASNGLQAVDLAARLQPDVLVMDVNMPEMDGKEATRLIAGRYPDVRVIGLSMFAEPDVAEAMRAAGAAGYLAKTSGPDALIAAIRSCAGGRVPTASGL